MDTEKIIDLDIKINNILKRKVKNTNMKLKSDYYDWTLGFSNENLIFIKINFGKLIVGIRSKKDELNFNELTLNINWTETNNLKLIENLIDLYINLLTNNL